MDVYEWMVVYSPASHPEVASRSSAWRKVPSSCVCAVCMHNSKAWNFRAECSLFLNFNASSLKGKAMEMGSFVKNYF